MRIALLTGFGAGAVCGFMHFYALVIATDDQGGFFYYAPLLIFFAAIYFSIKRTSSVKHDNKIGFKDSLKVGGLTAVIMSVLIGIGFFIALTHTDVRGEVNYMLDNNMSHEEVKKTLSFITKQNMFDRAKFFAMPYFLLGFIMTVGVAALMKRRKPTEVK